MSTERFQRKDEKLVEGEERCPDHQDHQDHQEQHRSGIKSVRSSPAETFDSSKKMSNKVKFRTRLRRILTSSEGSISGKEKCSSDSIKLKEKKSFGEQCRSFIHRLFRSKTPNQTPVFHKRSFSLRTRSPPRDSFASLDSSSKTKQESKSKKKVSPNVDVVLASPNNAFKTKSMQVADESQLHSSSFPAATTNESSSSPRSIINTSPTVKVFDVTSVDKLDESSNDCLVLNFTQREVETKRENLKSVQSVISPEETLKVGSSSFVVDQVPAHNQNKLKFPGYYVTVTPTNKSPPYANTFSCHSDDSSTAFATSNDRENPMTPLSHISKVGDGMEAQSRISSIEIDRVMTNATKESHLIVGARTAIDDVRDYVAPIENKFPRVHTEYLRGDPQLSTGLTVTSLLNKTGPEVAWSSDIKTSNVLVDSRLLDKRFVKMQPNVDFDGSSASKVAQKLQTFTYGVEQDRSSSVEHAIANKRTTTTASSVEFQNSSDFPRAPPGGCKSGELDNQNLHCRDNAGHTNEKADEKSEVLDKLLINAMRQLEHDSQNRALSVEVSPGNSSIERQQRAISSTSWGTGEAPISNKSFKTGIESIIDYEFDNFANQNNETPVINGSDEISNKTLTNNDSSENALQTCDILSDPFSKSGTVTYSSFFSKEPLILYSRNSLQKGGESEILSPDSGVSSIHSPASGSAKSFSTSAAKILPSNEIDDSVKFRDEFSFTINSSSSECSNPWHHGSSQASLQRLDNKPPPPVKPSPAKLWQPSPSLATNSDGKLINVVIPTPFAESQNASSTIVSSDHQNFHLENMGLAVREGKEKVLFHAPDPSDARIVKTITIDGNWYPLQPLAFSNTSSGQFDGQIGTTQTGHSFQRYDDQTFPSVPPPSYNSVVYRDDPADLSRFSYQFSISSQPASGPVALKSSQDTPKSENIYDFIPAAGEVLHKNEGIYEQIPYEKNKEHLRYENVARMFIEPKIEHIEFSLKPIHLHLPHKDQDDNYVSSQNDAGTNLPSFQTFVKPPVKDLRTNYGIKEELKTKLKHVGNIEDKFNIIKEEYLGRTTPSQACYKPHYPQTFSPVQVVQDMLDLSPKNTPHFEESYSNVGFKSEDLIEDDYKQRRLTFEKIMEIERQKKMFKEKLEAQSRRHTDYYSDLEKSPVSADLMREDLFYDNIEPPRTRKTTKYRGRARALYNFKAQKARELSLRKGDIVYLLRRVDKNWFEGEHHTMTGIFPVSYVEILESIEEAHSIARMREGSATVLYDFYPRSTLELPLKKSYVVTLIKRLDENWYEGRCGDQQGIFPVAYVSTIREPDTPLSTPCATPVPTPSSSRIHTPLPGGPTIPGWQSPSVGSIFSLNPEIPSAPRSPTNFSTDFSRESTPFGGSVIAGPTYHFHRPSSVMSEPVQMRDYKTLPNIMATRPKVVPSLRELSFIDHKPTSHRSTTLPRRIQMNPIRQENLYEIRNFGNAYDWETTSEIIPMDRTMAPQSFYKNYQTPTTFTSLKNRNSYNLPNEFRATRKKSTKLSFAPIPEKDTESDAIKPIIYPRYRALHDFEPRSPEELELQKNEIVRVVERCKDGWYIGFLESTRQFGLFPGNFVEPVKILN